MNKNSIGSCLCNSVQYEVKGDFDSFFLCHCSRCRKDTGSAHAANLFSATAELYWLAGEDKVKTYNLPSTLHTRAFCTNCGSALPVQMDNGLLVVPAGSLDNEIGLTPNAHIFVSARAAWDNGLEQVPQLDGLPE